MLRGTALGFDLIEIPTCMETILADPETSSANKKNLSITKITPKLFQIFILHNLSKDSARLWNGIGVGTRGHWGHVPSPPPPSPPTFQLCAT